MSIKNKGGRPRKEINYEQLDELCRIQCTGEECANILGVSYEHLDNQLEKDGNGGFLHYFQQKGADGKASLRRRQYKAAIEEGNPTMLIWLGKQWLKQIDQQTTKMDVNLKASVYDLSDEELLAIAAKGRKATP